MDDTPPQRKAAWSLKTIFSSVAILVLLLSLLTTEFSSGLSLLSIYQKADLNVAITQFTQGAPSVPPIDLWAQFVESEADTAIDEDTLAIHRVIDQYQQPEDCESRKFLMWQHFSSGIGASLHMLGVGIQYAMNWNRTLIYHPESHWMYTEAEDCPGRQNGDCYFHPISKCQYMAQRLLDEQKASGLPVHTTDVAYEVWKDEPFVPVYYYTEPLFSNWMHMPDMYAPADYTKEDKRPWWRAITTRYIMKFRDDYKEWIKGHFATQLKKFPTGISDWSALSSPPPESAICMHVRHGDKAREMKLHPFEEYMAAADSLVKQHNASSNIFIVTDDDGVIKDIEEGVYGIKGFTFYYTIVKRTAQYGPEDAVNGGHLPRTYLAKTTFADLTLITHPACRWFVLTTGSNFDRLVNEVRKTDAFRKDAVVIDLEPGEFR